MAAKCDVNLTLCQSNSFKLFVVWQAVKQNADEMLSLFVKAQTYLFRFVVDCLLYNK